MKAGLRKKSKRIINKRVTVYKINQLSNRIEYNFADLNAGGGGVGE